MFSIIQDEALKLRHLNTTIYFTAVLQQVALHSMQHYLNLQLRLQSPFLLLCLKGHLHAVPALTTECILTRLF